MSDIPAVVGLEPVAWMCTVEDVSGYYYYYIVGDKRPDQDHTTFEPLYLATDVARLQAKLAAMTQERDDLLQARAICPECAKKIDEAAGIDLVGLNRQLAASQAYAAQLREAWEKVEKEYFFRLKEQDELTAKLETEKDMYGWNFHKGLRGGLVEFHIYMTKIAKAIALPQDDTALREWGAKLLEEMRENCHYDRDADMLRHKTAELMGQ